VSVGGNDTEHDWYLIFSNLGLLNYDTTIASLPAPSATSACWPPSPGLPGARSSRAE
jgi:hypothetical protein